MVQLKNNHIPTTAELVALYDSVGWAAYTAEPATLHAGVSNSAVVATAWDENRLVGLARVISDKHTIAYLQDILVHPDYQRRGIATALLKEVFAPLSHIRQHVLLTDDRADQRAFYQSCGFTETHDCNMRSFVRFQ